MILRGYFRNLDIIITTNTTNFTIQVKQIYLGEGVKKGKLQK